MPKRKGDFYAWRSEKLADPINAADYLNAALEDSPEIFLDAVKDVIQARTVSKVAAEANVARESLYRSFSATGNPTLETLGSVLHVLGLKLSGVVPRNAAHTAQPSLGGIARAHKARRKYGRRGIVAGAGQLSSPFNRMPVANSAQAQSIANIASIEQTEGHMAEFVNIVPEVNILPGFFSQPQYGGSVAMGMATNAAR